MLTKREIVYRLVLAELLAPRGTGPLALRPLLPAPRAEGAPAAQGDAPSVSGAKREPGA